MRVAIIGRSEVMYESAQRLRRDGHDIALIITANPAPEYSRTVTDFQDLASAWNIPFVIAGRIETAIETIRRISDLDIGVSFNYSGVIPAEVISLFPLGILNAHGGDLPRYRGNACQAWAILRGEPRIGLCIHRMIGGELDSGDLIDREYLPIDVDTKITAVWTWISARVPELFSRALQRLSVDHDYVLEVQSKDPNAALRCYPRHPEDGRIQWTNPAIDVVRLVNASNKPYAGAFFFSKGRKITVWDATLENDGERYCAVPGQVTRVDAHCLVVACGSGKVRLSSFEEEGTPVAATTVARSLRERLG
jgi:UDP-4-amino-4-deoxy-L-arabinose formyltransferase/UDP-glucuronic acid dehydrogenase (UDP-4-keto-hexauronic acid decarboxylating)